MSNSLKRWVYVGVPGVLLSLITWWNVPQVINSSLWALGFLLELSALLFCIWLIVDILRRLFYATGITILIFEETGQVVRPEECLDIPYRSKQENRRRLQLYQSDSDLLLYSTPLLILQPKDLA